MECSICSTEVNPEFIYAHAAKDPSATTVFI